MRFCCVDLQPFALPTCPASLMSEGGDGPSGELARLAHHQDLSVLTQLRGAARPFPCICHDGPPKTSQVLHLGEPRASTALTQELIRTQRASPWRSHSDSKQFFLFQTPDFLISIYNLNVCCLHTHTREEPSVEKIKTMTLHLQIPSGLFVPVLTGTSHRGGGISLI